MSSYLPNGPPSVPDYMEPAPEPASANHSSKDKRIMRELHNSLLFRCDWPSLVSAVPLCMSRMGACCLAAYSSNTTITLDLALSSGFKFDTLKANIAVVSNTGCEALHDAEEKMSMVSDTSLALWDTVGKISENISSLPNPDAMKLLQTEFNIFTDAIKRCDQLTQEVQTTFKSWGSLVRELRNVIIHTEEKSGESAWAPGRCLTIYPASVESPPSVPVPTPVLPGICGLSAELVDSMSNADCNDVLWKKLPCIEMWLRRCYKMFTGDEAGGLLRTYAASTEGQVYLATMAKKLGECRDALLNSQAAKDSPIGKDLVTVISWTNHIKYVACSPPEPNEQVTAMAGHIIYFWSTARSLLLVAAKHCGLTAPVNTWDPRDPMDKLYDTEIIRTSAPPPSPAPKPAFQSPSLGETLCNCAESLAEASDEIAKLTRFFGAISCHAQHIVHSHVRSFSEAVSAVLNDESGEVPTKKQQQELETSARVVQSSFCLIHAIANMYVEISEDYVHKGCRLLGILSKSAAVGGIAYKSQMLQDYVSNVESRLAGSMKEMKENVFREAERNLREFVEARG